jgi:hypothetical protein
MRLLSIFALLFLISVFLHECMKERPVLEKEAMQNGEKLAEFVGPLLPQEDFSMLVFKPPYPVGHFDFESEGEFSIIQIELKNLIVGTGLDDNSFKNRNTFCAVGYEFPRVQQGRKKERLKREVLVYWRESRMLYRWTGGDPKAEEKDFYAARSLLYSPHSIPLDAPAEALEDMFGDDPEQYKARADNTIADCERHGKQYVIEAFRPPPRGFNIPGRPRPRAPATPSTPAPPTEEPGV